MGIKKGILISFGELFLKSEGVRNNFIKRLIVNLGFLLKKEKIEHKIYFLRDKIFIKSKDKKAKEIVKNVFGISNVYNCFYCDNGNLEDIFDFVKKEYKNWIKENETYGLRIKAENQDIKSKRAQIIDELAFIIKRKVNLSPAGKEIIIEIRKKGFLIYFDKEKGAGGLPVGSSGKVLVMMSGGIDSPVASYLMAKRGAENIWIHFHSFPLVSDASIKKIEELARIFLKFQPKLTIYFVPFSSAQMEIKTKAPGEYRVLLYRRLMLKIANKILAKEKCQAFATGESLGQVSSQTLKNIAITEQSARYPILRPLIGMDKEEIIKIAEEKGFFNISIKPQEDCCTLFVSKHQTAEGNMNKIKDMEKKINSLKIIKECMKGIEIKNLQ